MTELETPPTEIEIAELNHAIKDFGPLGGVLGRLAFQRDKLEAEVERLKGEMLEQHKGQVHIIKQQQAEIEQMQVYLRRAAKREADAMG